VCLTTALRVVETPVLALRGYGSDKLLLQHIVCFLKRETLRASSTKQLCDLAVPSVKTHQQRREKRLQQPRGGQRYFAQVMYYRSQEIACCSRRKH
jgi:hypothetical protein